MTAAKVTAEYAKGNDKFVVLGGFMGDKILDAKGVETLSKLPSLDQIRASFLGLLNDACDPYRRRRASSGRPTGPRVQRVRHQGRRVSEPASISA